jgi:hypothetical protein
MASFDDALEQADAEALRAFIVDRANASLPPPR